MSTDKQANKGQCHLMFYLICSQFGSGDFASMIPRQLTGRVLNMHESSISHKIAVAKKEAMKPMSDPTKEKHNIRSIYCRFKERSWK
jgi:hypothetical protein